MKKFISSNTRSKLLKFLCFPFLFQLIFIHTINCQNVNQRNPNLTSLTNSFIRNNSESVTEQGIVIFSENSDIREGFILEQQRNAIGLGVLDQLRISKFNVDEVLGMVHKRYEQYYNEVKVENAEYLEHYLDCRLQMLSSTIIANLNINTSPTISSENSIQQAILLSGSIMPSFYDEQFLSKAREIYEDPNYTTFPVPELLIAKNDTEDEVPENYKLVWKVRIESLFPSFYKYIYIDAFTGSMLKERDIITHNGPAVLSSGYGTRTIDTRWRGGFKQYHETVASDNRRSVQTRNGDQTNFGDLFKDNDDNWDASDIRGTTAHWCVSNAWDYWQNSWGHRGMNGQGDWTEVRTEWVRINAAFIPGTQRLLIGSVSENGPILISNDVAGHEFTHGVTEAVSGLQGNEGESGALNESFSDIFGNMVEQSVQPLVWTVGEDCNFIVRNMSNPNALGHPSIYLGPFWTTDTRFDQHVNSGVQNFWFFLLSQGGTQLGFNVQGIGTGSASRIAQFSLFNFIGVNTTYPEARDFENLAARLIFGRCSHEERQCILAWSACGLPAPTPTCVNITGSSLICTDDLDLPLTFTAHCNDPLVNITWSNFPLEWNYTISGNRNQFFSINNLGSWVPPFNPYVVSIRACTPNGECDTHQISFEECYGDPRCPKRRLGIPGQEIKIDNKVISNNPYSSIFELENEKVAVTNHYELYNLQGKLIRSFKSIEKGKVNETISNDLPNGIYILVNNQTKETFKIIR